MSRGMVLALGLSLAIHAAMAAYFLITRSTSASFKHGSIAVDFIQTVAHGEAPADPHNHPGRKVQRRQAPENAKQTALPSTEAGDPASSARESEAYIAAVARLISSRRIYPRNAVAREEEGRVVLGVSLDREGHVISAKIEQASPFESLNQAALETVKAVGRFPPLPESVADPVHLHIPLIFKIESSR